MGKYAGGEVTAGGRCGVGSVHVTLSASTVFILSCKVICHIKPLITCSFKI